MDDNQLKEHVAKAIEGDQQSLSTLFNEYKDAVYCFLTHYIDNTNSIEDVIQETFISAFRSLDKLENPLKIKSWLFTIAYRRAMDFYRTNKLPQTVQMPEELLENAEEDNSEFIPSEMLESEETRAYIVGLVKQLPEVQKTVVLLYYYQQMTVTEISKALDCSEGTVKSRLNYARKFIKADIDKQTKKGRKVIVVVPLPLLTQILLQQAEQTKLSKSASDNVWAGIEGSLNQMPQSYPSIDTKTTASGIKVAGITVPAKLIAVAVGITTVALVAGLIAISQPKESDQALLNPDGIQGNIQTDNFEGGERFTQNDGSKHDFTDLGIIDLKSKSDYAKMYYDMIQRGHFNKEGFLDAEMALTTDGSYSLEMVYSEGGEYNNYYVIVDIDKYDFTTYIPQSIRKSSGCLISYGDNRSMILGQTMIFNLNGQDAVSWLNSSGSDIHIVLKSSSTLDLIVNYKLIENDYYGGDPLTGEPTDFKSGDYVFSSASGSYEEFEYPSVINLEALEANCISTWGVGHGENDFTKGERLTAYFE